MTKTIIIFLIIGILKSEGSYVMKCGEPLSNNMIQIAKEIGIEKPEEIRTYEKEGKIFGHTKIAGITLGKAIEIRKNYKTDSLICHELIHVKQYQDCGGIKGFLNKYVGEVSKYGYWNSPMEIEAREKSQVLINKYNLKNYE
jgi:hypothetical protein